MTIYRNSGDIVLNRGCPRYVSNALAYLCCSTKHTSSRDFRTFGEDNIRHPRDGDTSDVYVRVPSFRIKSKWRCVAEYIIIITGRELRGRFMANNIYRATDFEILPLNPDVSVQNPPNRVEAHLLALVRSHLYGGYFLYSYGWDLTRRLQAQWETLKDDAGKALWEVVSCDFLIRYLDFHLLYLLFYSRRMIVSSGTSMRMTLSKKKVCTAE